MRDRRGARYAMWVPQLTLQVPSASVVALLAMVLAVVAPAAAQDCPVAVGPGCDRILLTVNGVQKDGTAPADYPVNWKVLSLPMGLRSAGESGSAQPWLSGYKSIDNWLAQNQRDVSTVVVFDLRQESHGFVGGMPVSWYFGRDQVNCGRSPTGMLTDELLRLQSLKPGATAYRQLTEPTDTACRLGVTEMALPGEKVATEESLVRSLSGPARRWLYWRIYAADFHAPSDEAVDQFVMLIKTVPANSWLHFHCAGGDGRTTTFMTMADMMRNAKTTAYDVILRRQESLPGAVDFGGYCKTAKWKRAWARERDWFIALFYAYCKRQAPLFEQKFSSWKAQHSSEVPRPPACTTEASPSS